MNPPDIPFFNPYAKVVGSQNRLPHWQQFGATYFITFHLGDSIPVKARRKWEAQRRQWLDQHPKPWDLQTEETYHRRFTHAIDRWLDAGHGSCVLKNPDCAGIVQDSLLYFDRIRYSILAFVVMPNHVHLLVVQNEEWPIESILHSWKRHSAREINKLLGSSGKFWMKDYFDRLVRDEVHFLNCLNYIRENPPRAHLSLDSFRLYENPVVSRGC